MKPIMQWSPALLMVMTSLALIGTATLALSPAEGPAAEGARPTVASTSPDTNPVAEPEPAPSLSVPAPRPVAAASDAPARPDVAAAENDDDAGEPPEPAAVIHERANHAYAALIARAKKLEEEALEREKSGDRSGADALRAKIARLNKRIAKLGARVGSAKEGEDATP